MSCNHRSSRCVCFDLSLPRWKEAMIDAHSNEGYTLEKIGSLFGCTRQAMCKAEHKAIAKMKQLLLERGISAENI